MEKIVGFKNQGYKILIQGKVAVLAKNSNSYVAWKYNHAKAKDGNLYFYDGVYGNQEKVMEYFQKLEKEEKLRKTKKAKKWKFQAEIKGIAK